MCPVARTAPSGVPSRRGAVRYRPIGRRWRRPSTDLAPRRRIAQLAVASRFLWLRLNGMVRQKISGAHPKGARQGVNHGQRWVGLGGLDSAHVGSEEAAALSQILLRHLRSQAQLAHTSGERLLRRRRSGLTGGCRHTQRVREVHSFIHTLIRTFEASQSSRADDAGRASSAMRRGDHLDKDACCGRYPAISGPRRGWCRVTASRAGRMYRASGAKASGRLG